MNSINDIKPILDRYRGRVSARVAEDCGNTFDISLEVDGIEIMAVRLLSQYPVMIHRNRGR